MGGSDNDEVVSLFTQVFIHTWYWRNRSNVMHMITALVQWTKKYRYSKSLKNDTSNEIVGF